MLLPAVVQAQFSYTTNNGMITITAYTGSDGVVNIPNTIDGLPVTSIGTNAFAYAHNLNSVTIGNSVTNIGRSAFIYCTNLTSVTIPNSVLSIGGYAFQGCKSLAGVLIPSSVTNIGSLGNSPFANCTSLTAITVDASNPVFSSVEGVMLNKSETTLTQYPVGKAGTYTLPNSVTNIGVYAFEGCAKMTSVTMPESVLRIGFYAFYSCATLTNITIGNSVISIGMNAFEFCTSLTSVTIGTNVTNIGASAFESCTNLSFVTIPKSVISIGPQAFYQCSILTGIEVDALNPVYSSRDGVLLNKGETRLIKCPEGKAGNYTIPSTVTTIDGLAFVLCTSLTAIEVDALNPVYSGVGGVLLDKSLTTLIKCPGGKAGSYSVPNSVTNIGSGAFSVCISLTYVTIPESVTSIGSGAFANCTSLTAIEVDALNPIYRSLDGVLLNNSLTTIIQCPGGKAGSYAIPDSVTNIGNNVFSHCTSLTNVTIPDNVTSIGSQAFLQCDILATVTIGNGVTNIGSFAFYYCTNLIGIYFSGSAPSLGSSGFFGDNNATVYYLPGTAGWGPTYGERPTALWQPQMQTGDTSFGVHTNQFGFKIAWASGQVIVVEACTNLANPIWSPLQTNTLTSDSLYFSDPEWTNYPSRFYRLRSP